MPAPQYRHRYAWRYGRPHDAEEDEFARPSPRYARRLAGWRGLLGDDRARRIASARAAGYLVMRSRTYEYPDGTQVRSLRPMYLDDFE